MIIIINYIFFYKKLLIYWKYIYTIVNVKVCVLVTQDKIQNLNLINNYFIIHK